MADLAAHRHRAPRDRRPAHAQPAAGGSRRSVRACSAPHRPHAAGHRPTRAPHPRLSPDEAGAALTEVREALSAAGLTVSEHDRTYRLVTDPHTAEHVRRFLQEESRSELSRAALETLAIVAYRGPVTKAQIEHIRGV